MKTIQLICPSCSNPFDKPLQEYNRRIRLGKTICYCSLKCAGAARSEAYDPFLYLLKEIKKRAKKRGKIVNLDTEDLRNLWEKQNQKCSYTNLNLSLPRWDRLSELETASIDRIDSDKDYTIDNIEFVSLFINLGKNCFTKNQVTNFLEKFRVV